MAKTDGKTANDRADETAISVLAWLATEPDLMARFLSLSGLTAENLRSASAQPGFFAGVLGFLMNHEPTLIRFCAATGQNAATVATAYRTLAGEEGHSDFLS